jgi:electron transfer flavoprotein beta subunit
VKVAVLLKPPTLDSEPEAEADDLAPCERAALEAALSLVENKAPGRLIALTVGPETHERVLREALRRGAHEAVRIWDAEAAKRVTRDDSVVPRLLAAALRQLAPDVTLAGNYSAGRARGVVGPTTAQLLHVPHLTQINAVERVETDPPRLRAILRRAEVKLEVTLSTPALLTIGRGPVASHAPVLAEPAGEIQRLTSASLAVDLDDVLGPAAPELDGSLGRSAIMLGSAADLADRLQALLK